MLYLGPSLFIKVYAWKHLSLNMMSYYFGPLPLAKVFETFVPKDDVVLYLGPLSLAKVLETFVPKDDVILYLGPSPPEHVRTRPRRHTLLNGECTPEMRNIVW